MLRVPTMSTRLNSSNFKLQVNTDYTEDTISISNYPLSGALTCTKLCTAFEEVWGII